MLTIVCWAKSSIFWKVIYIYLSQYTYIIIAAMINNSSISIGVLIKYLDIRQGYTIAEISASKKSQSKLCICLFLYSHKVGW